jgi:hypothetical protein
LSVQARAREEKPWARGEFSLEGFIAVVDVITLSREAGRATERLKQRKVEAGVSLLLLLLYFH